MGKVTVDANSLRRLAKEVERLKDDMRTLKEENKFLKKENKDLRNGQDELHNTLKGLAAHFRFEFARDPGRDATCPGRKKMTKPPLTNEVQIEAELPENKEHWTKNKK